jgi:two-component system phosphate regulon sensor histidine kinase PhoR
MRFVLTADIWGLLLALTILGALVGIPLWLAYRSRQEAESWRETLMQLPVGALLYDKRGRQILSNEQGGLLSRSVDPAQVDQVLQAGLKGAHRTTLLNPNEGASIQVQSWPLGGKRGWVLVTLRDVAEQQQAASNYRKFIYSVSHELLTPLTAVRGHLAHIEQATAADEDATWRGSLDVARGEIERLTRLTSNLLLLSRLEGGQPSQRARTSLTAIAEETALQMLEKADERHITLNIEAAPDLPRLMLDRDAWKQVFLNLIDNGIKYGKEGGLVEVKLAAEGDEVGVTVRDDGPGIAPEDLPHVFDEMYRADRHRDVGGSGLGLAIVRGIVEQHGGKIVCESKVGGGTTFQIRLPVEESVTIR